MLHSMVEGKTAFVTGSTRGIGWAVARALAAGGATVLVHGHSSQEKVDARVTELCSLSPDKPHGGYVADFADPRQIESCFQRIYATQKRLDILVNNAGVLRDALIGMISVDMVQHTFGVNTIAVAHCIQAGSRLMMKVGKGSIVNVSSIIGTFGNEGQLVYGGSKAAIIGMTKSAAKELANKNIRVNAVAPGFIDTDMTRQLSPGKYQERLNGIKMGRAGTPEEVANVITFLASDLSSYVTGQVLGVDGGMVV